MFSQILKHKTLVLILLLVETESLPNTFSMTLSKEFCEYHFALLSKTELTTTSIEMLMCHLNRLYFVGVVKIKLELKLQLKDTSYSCASLYYR